MLTVTFLKLDQRFVTASSGGLHFNSGYFGPGGDHKINFIIIIVIAVIFHQEFDGLSGFGEQLHLIKNDH